MKEKVLITGASGALAKRVKIQLEDQGFHVATLTTNKKRADGESIFYWDTSKKYIDDKSVENCSHIIHLAGFSIVKKWSKVNMQKMYDSRITASQLLHDACGRVKCQPKTFVSASAIGFYGLDAVGQKKEEDAPATDWLAKMCVGWESAASKFKEYGSRVVQLRISLLLTKDAGFLAPTLLSAKLGCTTVFGSGKQPIEWMHIDDVSSFVLYALQQDKIEGPYNMASSQKMSQYQFMKVVRKLAAPYSLLIKVPHFVLSFIFGKRCVILEGGCQLNTDKLSKSGFQMKYPTLEKAIQQEL
jgi:uncharacterized protein (TIGR01777 family)